jgi:hypothetical protein
MRRRTAVSSSVEHEVISTPFTRDAPGVGSGESSACLSSVVLPDPLPPSRTKIDA